MARLNREVRNIEVTKQSRFKRYKQLSFVLLGLNILQGIAIYLIKTGKL